MIDRKKAGVASAAGTLAAATFAIVVSTGMLAIGLVVASAIGQQSLADFLAETFPRFRGGAEAERFPMAAYAVFFLYVVMAAQIAILSRRALMRRGRG